MTMNRKDTENKLAIIDIDDVLSNTTPRMLDEVNRLLGSDYKIEDMDSYYLWENFPISKEDVYSIAVSESLVASLEPLPNSIEGVSRLKKSGFQIWLVTARPENLRAITINWLNIYRIQFDKLVMGLVGSEKTNNIPKHIELAIEDRYDTALAFSKISNKVYMLIRPWNKDKQLPDNVKGICSWDEIE